MFGSWGYSVSISQQKNCDYEKNEILEVMMKRCKKKGGGLVGAITSYIDEGITLMAMKTSIETLLKINHKQRLNLFYIRSIM